MAQQAGNKGWRKRLKATVKNMAEALNAFFEIRAEAGDTAAETQEAMLFRAGDTVGGDYALRKGFGLDSLVGLTLDEEVMAQLPADVDAKIGFSAGSDGGGTARIGSYFEVFVAVKERGDEWPPFFDPNRQPPRSANADRTPADDARAPAVPADARPDRELEVGAGEPARPVNPLGR